MRENLKEAVQLVIEANRELARREFEIAKAEGLHCNECEFWGQKVRGIDWAEFSLCYFKDGP